MNQINIAGKRVKSIVFMCYQCYGADNSFDFST